MKIETTVDPEFQKFTDPKHTREYKMYQRFFLLIEQLNEIIKREGNLEPFNICLDDEWKTDPIAKNNVFQISTWSGYGVSIRLNHRKFSPYPGFDSFSAEKLFNRLLGYYEAESKEAGRHSRKVGALKTAAEHISANNTGNGLMFRVHNDGKSRFGTPRLDVCDNIGNSVEIHCLEREGFYKIIVALEKECTEEGLKLLTDELIRLFYTEKKTKKTIAE